MGYAARMIGYMGYAPSDDTIVIDATEYTTTSGSWVEKITGYCPMDVSPESILRFRAELKHDAAGQTVYVRVLIDGVEVCQMSRTNVAYAFKSEDVPVTWKRGAIMSVQMRETSAGSTGYMRNFQICGIQTPMGID